MAPKTEISESPTLPCADEHFSVGEIAVAWKVGDDLVRKIFEDEPGVISIGAASSTGRKRRYVTLRVPKAVLERVHRRLQISGGAR